VHQGDSFQVQTVNNRRVIPHTTHAPPAPQVIAAYAILKVRQWGRTRRGHAGLGTGRSGAQAKSVPKAVPCGMARGGRDAEEGRPAARPSSTHRLDNGGAPREGHRGGRQVRPGSSSSRPRSRRRKLPRCYWCPTAQLEAHALLTDGGPQLGAGQRLAAEDGPEAMGQRKFSDLPAERFTRRRSACQTRLSKVKVPA